MKQRARTNADGWIDTRTPVVVVGGSNNGLGALRSLARTRIPCFFLYNDSGDPAVSTRFGTKVRVPGMNIRDLVPALRQIRESCGVAPVLILTNDLTTASLSECREELEGLIQLPLPDRAMVSALLEKDACVDLYRRSGVLQPETVGLSPGDGTGALEGLPLPWILKPADKPEGYSARFEKAYILRSAEAAGNVLASMAGFVEHVVVQQLIEGPESEVYFCLTVMDAEGGLAASFVGRKLNSWPPMFGVTARCVPAPEAAEELTAVTHRFFKQAGVCGFAALEFKRDVRDNRFYVIEPTVFRPDFQAEIATLNGINLPLAYYCVLTGQPVPPMAPGAQSRGWVESAYMRWLRIATDAPVAGTTPMPMVDAYWRWSDPGPWLKLNSDRFVSRMSKMLKGSRRAAG